MKKYVIDSSVVLEWITSVEEKEKPINILKRNLIEGKVELIAPEFLLLEVMNVLYWKKIYSPRDIKEFINWLEITGIHFFKLKLEDTFKVMSLVFKFNVTSYDALFLLLAKKEKCKLLTFDNQLLKIENLTIRVKDLKIE